MTTLVTTCHLDWRAPGTGADFVGTAAGGRATQGELDLLLDVCDGINGKCLCPLGDSDAIVVASYVAKFRDEFQAHLDHGGCPFGADSSLDRLFAPVDQHHLAPVAHETGV